MKLDDDKIHGPRYNFQTRALKSKGKNQKIKGKLERETQTRDFLCGQTNVVDRTWTYVGTVPIDLTALVPLSSRLPQTTQQLSSSSSRQGSSLISQHIYVSWLVAPRRFPPSALAKPHRAPHPPSRFRKGSQEDPRVQRLWLKSLRFTGAVKECSSQPLSRPLHDQTCDCMASHYVCNCAAHVREGYF